VKLTIKTLVLSTATFGLMLSVTQNAQAATLIPGVTASTTISTQWALNNAVNGQGLPGNTPSLTGVHGESLNGNSWRSNILSNTEGTTIPSGTITFNLNGSYNLSGFTFWNLGGGSEELTRQGINNVTIEYSNNGGTTWSTLSGAPSMFAQGTSGSPATSQVAQQFSFASVAATHVRFTNLSNFGGFTDPATQNRIGFSEIQFAAGTKIPEPSSLLALLAFGLAGVSLGKRI